MGKDRQVLGRGLASLITRQQTTPPMRQDDGVSQGIIVHIELDTIHHNPYQPRADFDQTALDELTRSIREKGIIQPITVRRHEGAYQLISGERRVRADREAGLQRIPAYIISVRSDEEMLELALVENLQREHLNPIEIAISYRRLIEECNYTQEEVAQRIGKDRTTVTNFLRLLRLPESIQAAVRTGEVTGGHARALLAVEDEKVRMALFRRIIKDGLSVRDIERLARAKAPRKQREVPLPTIAEQGALASVEERLRQLLGTKVQVRMLHGGRGEIVIEYYSADDLDRLLEIFEQLRQGYH